MNDQTDISPEAVGSDHSGASSGDKHIFRPHTEYGNAERMLDLYGSDLMSVPGLGWYAWTGKRWEPNENGAVERAAKKAIRRTYEQAAEDELHFAELMKWCRKSESRSGIAAMVSLA